MSPSHKPTEEEQAVKKILAEAKDPRAFGDGSVANVVRFFLREAKKGGHQGFVQSRATGKAGELDYAFYARMNTCSAEAFVATRELCNRIVSRVGSLADFATAREGSVSRVIVPRILLAVDKTHRGPFDQLFEWMRGLYQKENKTFSDLKRRSPDRRLESIYNSITIVEGTRCEPLPELLLCQGRTPKDWRGHVLELGVLHAMDVAIGMGDRLQSPSLSNVTVNPDSAQMVLVDVDSCLPPMGLGQAVDQLANRRTADEKDLKGAYSNMANAEDRRSWKHCPERLPLCGNYRDSVSRALDEDYQRYLAAVPKMKGRVEDGRLDGKVNKVVSPMGATMVDAYGMRMKQEATAFKRAAILALKEIRAGVNDGTLPLEVEDETCSARRLAERVNQWTF